MPLDRNNKPLQEGDEVILRARVTMVKQQEEYVNIELVPINRGRRGGGSPFWMNSGQVERADPPAPVPEPAAADEQPEQPPDPSPELEHFDDQL